MTTKRYCQCGADISLHKETATACFPCRHAASPVKTCCDCGTQFHQLFARKCSTCVLTNHIYRTYASGQVLAISTVLKARNLGQLPSAKTCICVDCGAQAEHYEHRDYNRPLDVVPTCRSCNRRRGAAIPKSWSFDEFWVYYGTLDISQREPFLALTKEDFEPIRRKYFQTEVAA